MVAARRKSAQLICRIDASAFAAIMLFLVMLFMHPDTRGFIFPRRVGVDLVKADNPIPVPGMSREDAIVINIQRDGTIVFGGERVSAYKIPSRIQERLNNGAERRVYLIPDARCKYAAVVEVIDSIRAAGVEPITFIVEKRPQTTSN